MKQISSTFGFQKEFREQDNTGHTEEMAETQCRFGANYSPNNGVCETVKTIMKFK